MQITCLITGQAELLNACFTRSSEVQLKSLNFLMFMTIVLNLWKQKISLKSVVTAPNGQQNYANV